MIRLFIVSLVSLFVFACSTPEKPIPSCAEVVKPIIEEYQKKNAQYLGPVNENGIHAEVFDLGDSGAALMFGEDAAMAQVQFPPHVTVEASGRCVVPDMPPLQYRAIKMKKEQPAQKERTL